MDGSVRMSRASSSSRYLPLEESQTVESLRDDQEGGMAEQWVKRGTGSAGVDEGVGGPRLSCTLELVETTRGKSNTTFLLRGF